MDEFGYKKQESKPDVWQKINQWKITKENALKQLYPGLNSSDLQYSKLLVDPARISPLLKALTDENFTLRQEIEKIACDLVSFTRMINTLVDENVSIQKHLSQRELEHKHLADSIELNKAEEINDYRHQIQQLHEENNLLVKHLEDLRNQQNEEKIQQLENELNNARDLYDQQQADFEFAKNRENDVVRQLEILSPKYSEAIDNVCELEESKKYYCQEYEKLKNQHIELKSNSEILHKDTEEKVAMQMIENRHLTQELDHLRKEKQSLQFAINNQESQLETIKKDRNRLQKECDEFKQISDQLYARGKDIKNLLEIEKLRNQNMSNKEKDAILGYEEIDQEKSKLELSLKQLQHEYDQLNSFNKYELDKQRKECEKILEGMKIKYTSSIAERNEQIEWLEKQIQSGADANDILKKELQISVDECNDLKQKLIEFQQQRRIIDQQSMEIRTAKIEIQDKKSVINQLEEKVVNQEQTQQDQEQRAIKKINEMERQIKELQKKSEEYFRMELQNDALKKENEQFHNDFGQLRIDYQQLKLQYQELEKKLGQCKKEMANKDEQIEELEKFKQIKYKKDDMVILIDENKKLRYQLDVLEKQLYVRSIEEQKQQQEQQQEELAQGQPQRGNQPYLKSQHRH